MRSDEFISENLKQWFKEKWVRFGPDGKIRGDCARGSEGEGKPKCLPQSKAQALGKKGRASAAAKKRREDPNPERRGPAKNVATKVKEGEVVSLKDDPAVIQRLVKQWWTGNEQQYAHAQQMLTRMGWDIWEDEDDIVVAKNGQEYTFAMDDYKDDLDENCWKGYHKEGNKELFGKTVPNCVKNEAVAEGHADQQRKVFKKNGEPVGEVGIDRESSPGVGQYYMKHYASGKDLSGYDSFEEAVEELKHCMKQAVKESHESCPECGGAMYPDTMINEKQDACYFKVKSRYKVWPSAYASGALVQCRKKGAKNWGNKSKNESQENMMDELSRIVELSSGMSAGERAELAEEFDLIESNINMLAERNGVDAEAVWEDLESLTDDELYVFAVTQPVMEDWQKANKKDRTAGMSQKAVNAYRRENPGSKLKTAVTTKPSKLKKGSKASKRRKSYCSRSRGQMKMHNISCAKTPDKAICAARRRWNCE